MWAHLPPRRKPVKTRAEAGSTEGPQHPLVSEIEREKVKPSREGIPESNRGRITSENRAYPAKEEARKLQCLRVSVRQTMTKLVV